MVPLVQGLLHILRIDNEDVGVICGKILHELVRTFRPLPDEQVVELVKVFGDLLHNMDQVVVEYFSDGSKPLETTEVLKAMRSFKVLTELASAVGIVYQTTRVVPNPVEQEVLPSLISFDALESSAQRKAREDYEAMGGVWAGVATSIVNPTLYTDMLAAQVKVSSTSYFQRRNYTDPVVGRLHL